MSLSDPGALPPPLPPDLAHAFSRARGRLGPFGRAVYWHPEVGSTNDLAARLLARGAAEGTIVAAGAQTAGRGRRGRTWSSPAGAGLYVSIALRPQPREMALLTIAAGVGLAEGIRTATGLTTTLKWPNDIMVLIRSDEIKKLAGILVEGSSSGCVLGFGINVRPAAYPPDVAARATSIESELGQSVDADALLVECVAALAARYDDLRRGRAPVVLDAWRAYARPLLGRTVEWDDRNALLRGVADDVDASGALIVRTGEGTVRVISGEVRWI